MPQIPINTYFTVNSVYPSNAQIWHVGKDASGNFSPGDLDKVYFGNTPAPKGHFILNAFDRDRDAVSGLTGITDDRDYDSSRPSTVDSFAGRVWFSGTTSQDSGGNIYYSQIITDTAKAGRCYQEQDPTAETFNQLLDTDGGVIKIPEVGTVIKLNEVGSGIAVLASNGVWHIAAGSQGFTPSSFIVNKISDLGATSRTSVVEAEGAVYFARRDGIQAIARNEFGVQLNNITDNKIKTLINNLSDAAIEYMYGEYDSIEKKIYWLYNDSDSYDGLTFRYKYNRMLVFDLRLQAFLTYTIGELGADSPHISGMVKVSNGVKFVTFVPNTGSTSYQVTFTDFKDTNFRDWATEDSGDGIDAAAYAVVGYETLGDPSKIKQAHVLTYMNFTGTGFTTEGSDIVPVGDSSCLMRAEWDWATSSAANKYSSQQQIYRPRLYIPADASDPYDYGELLVTAKTRIRGRGRALSLRFDSEEDKDLQLVGWTTSFTAKATT